MPDMPPINSLAKVYDFSPNRKKTKYAIQIIDGMRQPVKVLTIEVSFPGGMPIPAKQQMLNQRVIQFIQNQWPGVRGLSAIVIGRVDFEI